MNATDTPPCPDCGGPLTEHGPDDDSSANAYDCPLCGWGLQECDEPLTLASAPWTRALWCEVEIARRTRRHGSPTPAQLEQLQHLGWTPGEDNPMSWAIGEIARQLATPTAGASEGAMSPTTEELRALLAAATPGPWAWLTKAWDGEYFLYGGDACTGIKDDGARQEDLDLSALAPTLATEVLALRARVAELEARPLPELPEGWYEEISGDYSGPSGQWVRGRGDWVRYTGELVSVNLPRAVLLRALVVPDVR